MPVTLIEKVDDFSKFNVTRAFRQVIFYRGRKAISAVPGLLEHLAQDAVLLSAQTATSWSPDGHMKTVVLTRPPIDGKPDLHLLRADLSSSLRTFIETKCPSVNAMYGTSLRAISFQKNGEMHLSLTSATGEKLSLSSRLILSCDGRNSTVAQELLRAEKEGLNTCISSSNGFGLSTSVSPAVGLNLKSVLLKPSFTEFLNPGASPAVTANHTCALRGNRKNRSANKSFNIIAFPLLPKTVQILGGSMGLIAAKPNHHLWRLENTEQAYAFFEENFPQASIRKIICEEHMDKFLHSSPSTFCPITRRDSLAFYVGEKKNGGVLIMGDCAHSFPPDIGQGVNAALEDVAVLGKLLDHCEEKATLNQILAAYEKERDGDTSALTRIARLASPYQYGQNLVGLIFQQLNSKIRRKMADLFPAVFHPAMIEMVRMDLTFSEIAKRADSTTVQLYTILASISAVSAFGYLFISELAR